ncbi:dihydrodipicolinate synthase family protein [Planctomicrobium piriforme]|uniref:N-acetylneuraminate lyase n=1 Tax=Planctomicrobium piriforme TaxID=1576369 RepID=A0A1I3IMJ1_9PLAN|nr:dihydrodipicolinate synthase family protein [Planctomicrobium piriforme]SFI49194.1 N-acetylneuraminate lyase [Planctomicrobium piriforme]
MSAASRFQGLIAATHAPFHDDGSVNLEVIPKQADGLIQAGVAAAFVCGSTGEAHSLTVPERQAITRRWVEVARGTPLQVIAHVGHNCQQDAAALASAAQRDGVCAISALAPSYFKPVDVAELIRFLKPVAAGAGELPFYFYDIPGMTGVSLSMTQFLEQAPAEIPNLTGIKYTNPDLVQFQECLAFGGGQFDILFGTDECLLAGLTFGARGAVGSSYNFAAPIYRRLIAAFEKKDFATARAEQLVSVRLIRLLAKFGYFAAAKSVMTLLGVPVGTVRSPLRRLSADDHKSLERQLKDSDLWGAIQPS